MGESKASPGPRQEMGMDARGQVEGRATATAKHLNDPHPERNEKTTFWVVFSFKDAIPQRRSGSNNARHYLTASLSVLEARNFGTRIDFI